MTHLTWKRLLCLALLAAAIAAQAEGSAQLEFFVSPSGNDTHPGTRAKPFATVERARAAVRTARGGSAANTPALVHLRGGTYCLRETFTLGSDDSNTTYAAYRKEAVRLTGGRPITNFTAWSGPILKADLKAQGWAEPNFKVLVFDGRRQELARYPNRDVSDMNGGLWAHAAGKRYSMYQDSPDDPAYHAQHQHLDYWQRNVPRLTRTLTLADDNCRDWKSWEDAEVSIFPRFNWSHYLVGIESVDVQRGVLNLKEGCFYEIRPGDRYFVRNLLEELDAPGEWFLARRGAALYFWPSAAVTSGPVEAAGIGPIIQLVNCKNVSFRGLTIECGQETGIRIKDGVNCRIEDCTIRNVGDANGCGVEIHGGTNNGLSGCHIHDTGSHGVEITGGDAFTLAPGGHYVEDTVIGHVGLVTRHGAGVFLGLGSSGQRITHNLIHHTPHSGIMLWGNRHRIEHNEIHHTCLESEDTGGIGGGAIDWVSWLGVEIHHNYIHDTLGYGYDSQREKWRSPYFTHALYPDWAASGVDITSNIFVRAGMGLLKLHGGRDNRVENNIFVGGEESQVDCEGWTKATGYWSTKLQEWTAAYTNASVSPAWTAVRGFKDPRTVPLENGQVMYGNVLRKNIFYQPDTNAATFRFVQLALDRNLSESNLFFNAGATPRTGRAVFKSEHGPNLLGDSGLEETQPDSFPSAWGGGPGPSDMFKAAVVAGDAHAGIHALKLQPDRMRPEDPVPKMIYTTLGCIPFRPGKTYRLRVWLKSGNTPADLELMAFTWKNNAHHWSAQKLVRVGATWTEHELVFRLPAPGEASYRTTMDTLCWRLQFPTGTPEFYIDDASLREAELTDEWTGWRTLGLDTHSIIADPLFVNAARDDYRLRSNSPAFKLGFQPIPMDTIGPRKRRAD